VTHPCPADAERGELSRPPAGRTCGAVFPTSRGAALHAVFKKDDDHPHTVYQRAIDAIVVEDTDMDTDTDTDTDTDGTDGTDEQTDVRDPEIPPADDSHNADPSHGTADCPNCGDDLGHTEDEIMTFIDAHGSAYCDECEAEIVVQEDT
jgi:hypothetical protein